MTEKGSGRMSEKERCAEPFSQGASPEGPPSTTTCNEGPSEYIRARSACNDLRASRSTLRRGGLGFFDRSTVPVTVEEDPVERRREETRGSRLPSSNRRSPSFFCRRSDRSVYHPRWSHHSDGPGKRGSSNQGQSGHQSWHQPVDGTAREDQNRRVQPESDVRRKPAIRRGAETGTETDKECIRRDLVLPDDRGRSSGIKSDGRNDSSIIHQAVYYVYCIYGICWISRNYRASLVEVIAFIHFRIQEGKTGFHVSTRRA
ncbi:uncharacterized protein LOC112468310 [Temnothorax curvispinosus]|uniref:Uncharacterized protein LOC112468310 n=1 Tax=Temnothorax curvispinosus TaxID=300111 RepID=A0A6J1RE22_9HYME|nr:uncharacterized protein LOC112468310 [Temnothorax curvispinosus]